MEKTLADFRYFLLKKGFNPQSSVVSHVNRIKTLLKLVWPFTGENLEKFLLEESRLTSNSKNSYITTIRRFGEFLNDTALANLSYCRQLPTLKTTMSDEEIERFLKVRRLASQSKRHYVNISLFFKVLAFTGMRPGEVADLRLDDIDISKNVFVVRKSKTPAGIRLVPIPPNILSEVKSHLAGTNGEFFLMSTKNSKISRPAWGRAFRFRLKQIGVQRRGLTAYSLRHSLITSLINEDVSLFKIRELVGHKHITSTEPYVHIATKPLLLALQKHPIIRRQTNPAIILKSLSELVETYQLREDKRFSYELKLTDKKLGLKVGIK